VSDHIFRTTIFIPHGLLGATSHLDIVPLGGGDVASCQDGKEELPVAFGIPTGHDCDCCCRLSLLIVEILGLDLALWTWVYEFLRSV